MVEAAALYPEVEEELRLIDSPPMPLALGAAGTGVLSERAREARERFHSYAGFVLRDNHGHRIRQAILHRTWYVHVTACWAAGKHPAILAPWAHGKTQQLVIALPTWLVGADQSLRMKVVCNTDNTAMRRTMGISTILRSPYYRLTFPEVRPVSAEKAARTGQQSKWTQHDIYLDRPGFALDPTFQAVGVLSGGLGARCDLLIFDDVIDQKNAIDHPADRERVIANIDNVWMSRLESDGRCLYLGNMWHQADFSHKILERSAWCVLRQWISDDFQRIEQEVYNPPPGYPLPALSGAPLARGDDGWIRVDSSNLRAIRYDEKEEVLEVAFVKSGTYRYLGVPKVVYEGLRRAKSKGKYLAAHVKNRYEFERA